MGLPTSNKQAQKASFFSSPQDAFFANGNPMNKSVATNGDRKYDSPRCHGLLYTY